MNRADTIATKTSKEMTNAQVINNASGEDQSFFFSLHPRLIYEMTMLVLL